MKCASLGRAAENQTPALPAYAVNVVRQKNANKSGGGSLQRHVLGRAPRSDSRKVIWTVG